MSFLRTAYYERQAAARRAASYKRSLFTHEDADLRVTTNYRVLPLNQPLQPTHDD